MRQNYFGTEQLDDNWRVDKYTDLADLVPTHDATEHMLGDECWCAPNIVRPVCPNCQGTHFAIILHESMRDIPTIARDNARDSLLKAAMQ